MSNQETTNTEVKELAEKNREYMKSLITEGKLPEARALTRAERKKLDAAGHNLFKIKENDKRSLAEVKENLTDWILDTIYPDVSFDDVSNNVCNWFAEYVFAISYRDDLSEKN